FASRCASANRGSSYYLLFVPDCCYVRSRGKAREWSRSLYWAEWKWGGCCPERIPSGGPVSLRTPLGTTLRKSVGIASSCSNPSRKRPDSATERHARATRG